MAGFVALGNDRYIGTYTAGEEIENGAFVTLDHTAKTGTLADGGGDVYFIYNENDDVAAMGIDDMDFRVKKGDFLRAYKPIAGNILVTTCIEGELSEGATATISGGKVTAGEGNLVVKEVTNEFGVPTARLLVVEKPTP